MSIPTDEEINALISSGQNPQAQLRIAWRQVKVLEEIAGLLRRLVERPVMAVPASVDLGLEALEHFSGAQVPIQAAEET